MGVAPFRVVATLCFATVCVCPAALAESGLYAPTAGAQIAISDLPPRPVVSAQSAPGLAQVMPQSALTAMISPRSVLRPKAPSKIDSGLQDFLASARSEIARVGSSLDARTLSTERFLLSRSRQVQVYVSCSRWNDSTRAALEGLGMVIQIVSPAPQIIVQGWMPQEAVESAASLDFINSIGPPAYPFINMGSKTTESDAILRAATARTMYGIDGTGTRVGILSDSADLRSQAQATGDLPADSSIYVGKASTGANEGTAMMEIVYDEAPGALLGFYGPETSLDMATGITDLKNHGCNVIADDLCYIDQPCFEEGPIEQTINSVTAGGAVYITCAANYAQVHHATTYNSVIANVMGATNVDVHSFGNIVSGLSPYLMPVNCPANTTTFVVLQWDSPWGYAADDYDLYLCDAASTGYYAKSDNLQNGSQYPTEIITYNPGATGGWAFALVHRVSGAVRKLKIYVMHGTLDSRYQMAVGSIGFNNKAQNALVVGAISAANFGGGTIEPFSNQGPVTISYPAATTWNKPDITGIDGVQVTGAGGFAVPFYGTSAASPSVAGVAALVRCAKPTATVSEVKTAITQHAVDKGATGYDTVYGWGLADAVAAVQAVLPTYHLLYYASPSGATAGSPFTTQPVVAVLNQSSALVTTYTGAITVSIKAGTGAAGAALSGTVTVNAANGIATFSNLSINLAGTGYVLTASSTDAGTVDSSPFNVTAAPTPTKLTFIQQPGGATANTALSPQPSVAAQDAIGLTVTAFTGPVTLSIKAGTGTTGALLKGTATVNAVNGIATFSGISIDRGGTGYVLTATTGSLAVDSNPITIIGVNPPGDLDKNGMFNLADLVLGAKVLGGLSQFP